MKKVPNGSVVDDASQSVLATLTDTSILSSKVSANPITIQVQNLEVNYQEIKERQESNAMMDTIDVVLLTIMWICLSIALFLSIFICATISCRRVLVRSFKVASQQMIEPYVVTTDAGNFETNAENPEGPYDNAKTKLYANGEKYLSVKTKGGMLGF